MVDRERPGTVGVIFDSQAGHYSRFTKQLADLDLPTGSHFEFVYESGAFDAIAQKAIENDSYWVWFIKEDYTFSKDCVASLLSRHEEIVAPIVLGVQSPFLAQAESMRGKNLRLNPVVGPGSLIEIVSAPPIGLLVRRAMLEHLPAPWFGPEAEDFCSRAIDLGVQPYLDTSVRLGRRFVAEITPTHRADGWGLSIAIDHDLHGNDPLFEFSAPLKH